MRRFLRFYVPIFVFLLITSSVIASAQESEPEGGEESDRDFSLIVDEVLVQRGTLRKFVSFSYNSEVDYSDELLGISNARDALTATAGLRYGFSNRFEAGLYASWSGALENSFAIGSGSNTHTEHGFRNLGVSLSYRLMNDDGIRPALIVAASSALVESDSSASDEYSFGKTNSVSVRMYRIIDPVIVAGTITYQRSEARSVGGVELGARQSFLFSPTVSVAFNDRVTLSTGFSLSRATSVNVNQFETAPDRTRASLNLGLGYVMQNNRSLRLGVNTELLGDRSFGFNLGMDF